MLSLMKAGLIALLLTTHIAAADLFSSLGGSGVVACLSSHLQCSRSLSERDDYYRKVRCFALMHLNKRHKALTVLMWQAKAMGFRARSAFKVSVFCVLLSTFT